MHAINDKLHRTYNTRPARRAFESILHGRQPSGSFRTGMVELKHLLGYTVSPTPIPNENTANVQLPMCDESTCHRERASMHPGKRSLRSDLTVQRQEAVPGWTTCRVSSSRPFYELCLKC